MPKASAEEASSADRPALLDRACHDVEHRRPGRQQQHQRRADEQPEIDGAGSDEFHDVVRAVGVEGRPSPESSSLSTGALASLPSTPTIDARFAPAQHPLMLEAGT